MDGWIRAAEDRDDLEALKQKNWPYSGAHAMAWDAMIRSIALLVAAMHFTRPTMPNEEAQRYARALNEVASARGFDPLIAVAIVHFETQWRPTLVSADGEDYGLGQVRARYLAACRNDADPVNAPSEECARAKESLKDGVTNLRRMGSIIEANIDFCKARTGSGKLERWLSGYQGYGDAERGIYCKPGDKTFQVIGYYNELVEKLAPLPKKKAAPKGKTPAKQTKTVTNAAQEGHGAEPKGAPPKKKITRVASAKKTAATTNAPRRSSTTKTTTTRKTR